MSEAYGQLPSVFQSLSQRDLNFCVSVWRQHQDAKRPAIQQAISDGAKVMVDAKDLR